MNFETLMEKVESDIASYRYETPANPVGVPWTTNKIEAELAELRAALVSPYWIDVELSDTYEQIAAEQKVFRRCAVIVDDGKESLVAFDPIENEFLLTVRRVNAFISAGIRGDVVDCFMAR